MAAVESAVDRTKMVLEIIMDLVAQLGTAPVAVVPDSLGLFPAFFVAALSPDFG